MRRLSLSLKERKCIEEIVIQGLNFIKPITLLVIILFSPILCLGKADRIFKENNKAVVVIVAYAKGNPTSQGSGFSVRQDGRIVTSYHVLNNSDDIRIKAGDKILSIEGIIYIDKENDIVILKAESKGLPVVKLGDMNNINVGEKVYVISSPHGFENTISDGILSGIREINKRKILQITAPVSHGSSGAPVFNEKGEVIGIATSIIKEAQNINLAMPANLIEDKIDIKEVTSFKEYKKEDHEKSPEYWNYLGVAYFNNGRHSEAIEAFKQAIKINPNFVDAYYNLGVAYYNQNRYPEAIAACKQTIRINSDYADAYYALGIAYNKLGRHSEAMEEFKQAIKTNPDFADAYNSLGLATYNQKRYSDAIEAFKQAIRINPGSAEVHYNLGFTCLHINDSASALKEYNILKSLNPQLADKLFKQIYK